MCGDSVLKTRDKIGFEVWGVDDAHPKANLVCIVHKEHTMVNTLFHGTRQENITFEDTLIGRGAEPNSALGIWFTTEPELAFDYSGKRHLIEIVTSHLNLVALENREMAIWGTCDTLPKRTDAMRQKFVTMRLDLMKKGFHGVWCEMPGTDLEGAVCLFSSRHFTISRFFRFPEEHEVEVLTGRCDDVSVDFSLDCETRFLAA